MPLFTDDDAVRLVSHMPSDRLQKGLTAEMVQPMKGPPPWAFIKDDVEKLLWRLILDPSVTVVEKGKLSNVDEDIRKFARGIDETHPRHSLIPKFKE